MDTQEKGAAVVTGASKGIGAALARRLAADGFPVVVNHASGARNAEAVVGALTAAGGRATAVRADVADPAAMRALFDAAEATFGAVEVLVNNAGVLATSPLAEASDEDFERQVAVNLRGAFNGMREGARRLRDGGRIISVSTSIIGAYLPAHGVYAATKAGVEAMTHVLAKELGPRRITVNAIAPGPTATPLFLSTRSEDAVRQIVKDIPLGRLGEPDDLAPLVSFLAPGESVWVNGQVIRINGGRN